MNRRSPTCIQEGGPDTLFGALFLSAELIQMDEHRNVNARDAFVPSDISTRAVNEGVEAFKRTMAS